MVRTLDMRISQVAAALALAVVGCDASNPVAPVGAGEPAPATQYTVSVSATPPSAIAGVTEKVQVTVTVVRTDNNEAPAAGTTMTVSTSLGTLVDGSNRGSLLTVAIGGKQTGLELEPGSAAGTAEILVQLADSAGSLKVEVTDPGDPPVADFESTADELTVLFTDKSTGSPTAWYWSFDDPDDTTCPATPPDSPDAACTEQHPTHTYQQPGTYKVKLVVTNVATTVAASPAGFQSAVTKFVKVAEDLFILSVVPNRGSEMGEMVTITGTGGFRAPLRVFFGSKLGEVLSVSTTELKVNAPPGDMNTVACTNSAGKTGLQKVETPVNVVVELEDGTQESLEKGFTYEPDSTACVVPP